jgi:hypothetical protein
MSLTALIIIWLGIQVPLGVLVGKCIQRGHGDESMGVNAQSMVVNAHGKQADVFVDGLDAA